MKDINLNEIVSVELNNRGKSIYIKYENRENSTTKKIFPNIIVKKRNLEGKIDFLLWELFYIFGSSLDFGENSIFVNNVITFNKL